MVFVQWEALGPVYLHTQHFLLWKHLQYMVIIINVSIIVVIIGVPIVESKFTFMDDPEVGGDDLSFAMVLFMLNTHISFPVFC